MIYAVIYSLFALIKKKFFFNKQLVITSLSASLSKWNLFRLHVKVHCLKGLTCPSIVSYLNFLNHIIFWLSPNFCGCSSWVLTQLMFAFFLPCRFTCMHASLQNLGWWISAIELFWLWLSHTLKTYLIQLNGL